MLAEACENGWIRGANPARRLAKQPDRVKLLTRYVQAIKNLLATGIRLKHVEKQDFYTMLRVQHETGLLTNDALLVACAERLRVQAYASANQQLVNVQGFLLYLPDDLKK
jgi:predicted nucleic acid-binding protein